MTSIAWLAPRLGLGLSACLPFAEFARALVFSPCSSTTGICILRISPTKPRGVSRDLRHRGLLPRLSASLLQLGLFLTVFLAISFAFLSALPPISSRCLHFFHSSFFAGPSTRSLFALVPFFHSSNCSSTQVTSRTATTHSSCSPSPRFRTTSPHHTNAAITFKSPLLLCICAIILQSAFSGRDSSLFPSSVWLPPVTVTATAVDLTAVFRIPKPLTGRDGQRDGRGGRDYDNGLGSFNLRF
ncbi:hypothetical protein B0H14DRAFT_3454217 [Mycena olivaceomarginata]|nr:hypothetical protein B0H14DRAFT_3454217 [Mycena olivaceomarginata]